MSGRLLRGKRRWQEPDQAEEAEQGLRPRAIRQAIEEGWLKLQPLYADSDEHGIFAELRNSGFGLGGAASIAAACTAGSKWVFVSDDLDARREAIRRGIGVVGTYGVLARQVAEDRMGLEKGNDLLKGMIAAGFRSHSDDLREESEKLKSRR